MRQPVPILSMRGLQQHVKHIIGALESDHERPPMVLYSMPVFCGQTLFMTANTTNAAPSTKNVREMRDINVSNKLLLEVLFSTMTWTNSEGSGADARDWSSAIAHRNIRLGEQIRKASKARPNWFSVPTIGRMVEGPEKTLRFAFAGPKPCCITTCVHTSSVACFPHHSGLFLLP